MSGESISVSSVTGVNSTPSADSLARESAEANFYSTGSCKWAAKFSALAAGPLG